jgi:hypothetical protein
VTTDAVALHPYSTHQTWDPSHEYYPYVSFIATDITKSIPTVLTFLPFFRQMDRLIFNSHFSEMTQTVKSMHADLYAEILTGPLTCLPCLLRDVHSGSHCSTNRHHVCSFWLLRLLDRRTTASPYPAHLNLTISLAGLRTIFHPPFHRVILCAQGDCVSADRLASILSDWHEKLLPRGWKRKAVSTNFRDFVSLLKLVPFFGHSFANESTLMKLSRAVRKYAFVRWWVAWTTRIVRKSTRKHHALQAGCSIRDFN